MDHGRSWHVPHLHLIQHVCHVLLCILQAGVEGSHALIEGRPRYLCLGGQDDIHASVWTVTS